MEGSAEPCEIRTLTAHCPGCRVEIRASGTKLIAAGAGTVLLDLPGAWALSHQDAADCQPTLPVLGADGILSLYALADQRLLQRHDLSEVLEHGEYMIATASGSFLSCDGKRLFVPQVDGPGWQRVDLSPEADAPPLSDAPPVIAVSPDGRFTLELGDASGETATLRDYQADRTLPIGLRFELDAPFFDRSGQYLILRHASEPPITVSLYRLGDFAALGTLDVTEALDWTDLAITAEGGKYRLQSAQD